jgi:hypothetical protein
MKGNRRYRCYYKADSFDHWEITPELDPKMHVNSKAVLDPALESDKPKIVASKAKKRAVAYFALAFKTMKLLRLITKAKTEE